MRSATRQQALLLGLAASLLALPTLAATETGTPVKIGQPVGDFSLASVTSDERVSLRADDAGKATVLLFVSVECPISGSYEERMIALAREYAPKGVRFLALNASASESRADAAEHARSAGFPFPMLKDEGNAVADRLDAQVTPEAYVIDARGVLRYHGRIDDSQDHGQVKSRDLKAALDAVLAGKEPPRPKTLAFGCVFDRVER